MCLENKIEFNGSGKFITRYCNSLKMTDPYKIFETFLESYFILNLNNVIEGNLFGLFNL